MSKHDHGFITSITPNDDAPSQGLTWILYPAKRIMKLNVVRELLSSPSADAVQAFLDDESTVFWIDWRQEDETIAESCELTLNTGSLDGELIEKTDDGSDYHVEIIYNTKRERVPLTFSESDRHLTILTINRVLNPDYEIRSVSYTHLTLPTILLV